MANVVEILIKARDEATATLNRVASSTAGFGVVAGAAAGITAQLTSKLAELAGEAIRMPFAFADAVEQLDRLAARTGASVHQLQVMRQVIEENGGNVESLTTALSFLNRAIANQDPLLKELGITSTDAFEAMMQLAQAFSRSEDEAKKNAIAFKLLGRGGADLIAELNVLAGKYREVEALMGRSGALMGTELVTAARALDTQMDELGRNWKGLWTDMAGIMVPVANAIIDQINKIGRAMEDVDLGDTGGGRRARDITPVPTSRTGFGARDRDLITNWSGLMGDVSKVTLGDAAAESPREKRLKEIMRLLGSTRVEAERTLKALEAVEDNQKRATLAEALRSDFDSAARTDTSSDAKLRTKARGGFKIDDLQRIPELQFDALTIVREQWRAFADEMTSTAQVMNDSLQAVWDGIGSGLSTVFAGLLGETQTFKSAWTELWRSMVDSALQELARIVQAAAFRLFVRLALNAATAGTTAPTMGQPGFTYPSGGGFGAQRAPGSTTIINVNALDAKSGLEAAVSSFGMTRNVSARVIEQYAT